MESSLEVSQLIKVQQDVQIIQNTLFTRRQQQLMTLQRLRTIHLDSSAEDSENPLQKPNRIKARQLKKILGPLKGKRLNDLDITLLKGVICSNPFDEPHYFKEAN